jgi:hypothetical protein
VPDTRDRGCGPRSAFQASAGSSSAPFRRRGGVRGVVQMEVTRRRACSACFLHRRQ